jgi:hypothetical protein
MRFGFAAARKKKKMIGSLQFGMELIDTADVSCPFLTVVDLSLASPFFWKNRLEMVWHHELPSFQCIGVDAVVIFYSLNLTHFTIGDGFAI